ncbi:hypothetical protein ACSBPQ_10465 [Stenotrophomonas sp. JC08]|uniref:hypothetical protein n=1 Tax=Stenotrophomonas sp. JC08 TaxID=3445779 RepID=UPI003FA33631
MMFLLQPDYIVKEICKRQWNQRFLTAGWIAAGSGNGVVDDTCGDISLESRGISVRRDQDIVPGHTCPRGGSSVAGMGNLNAPPAVGLGLGKGKGSAVRLVHALCGLRGPCSSGERYWPARGLRGLPEGKKKARIA